MAHLGPALKSATCREIPHHKECSWRLLIKRSGLSMISGFIFPQLVFNRNDNYIVTASCCILVTINIHSGSLCTQ